MARRKPSTEPEAPPPAGDDFAAAFAAESQIFSGNQSLHDLFQQQVRQTLDQSDLDEDAKQSILVALACPCCGAGGMNYTAKLKRK